MKKTTALLGLSLLLATTACDNKDVATTGENNPFFVEWTTEQNQYGVPPFNEIKTEHYLPAFEEGMKQQAEEIAAIVNNTEEPTFENTIEAYERSGALLYKTSMVFFNMSSACNSDEMQTIAETVTPMLSKHADDINLNEALFARIKSVYDNQESMNLTDIQKRLLKVHYNAFVRGGANIDAAHKERFRAINSDLASLTLKFGDNVLKASNDYKLVVDDVARLEGMPANALAAALDLGNQDEATKGKYVFTIQLPSWEPLLTFCKDRELRKEMWTALVNRCTENDTDNREIINKIVNLRIERAKMFGFNSYAEYVLDDCMAKTPTAVNDLLMQVWTPAIAKAKEEAAEYQKMIDAEGGNFKLEACDWRYYAEKVREAKYSIKESEVAPYFSLENVRNGIFLVSEKLYGLTFNLNKDIPVYYSEGVDAFEVKKEGKVIAILYIDYYPRESKRSGAWMTNFREQWYTAEGENVIPIVSLVLNSAKPTADAPALLTFDQTSTFFHEFGHGLHGILANAPYRTLSGTNVSRDFVELPSQIMENWAAEPEVLKMYAKHYETGEVIPDSLIAKLTAAGTHGQGFINTELIAASLLDMHYHTLTEATEISLPEFEDNYLKELGLIPEIISRYRSPYFSHIFAGGYSAGYYGYTWAAVLDSDAFEAFKENGIFDPATAKSFEENILSKGNMEDAMDLYIKFRGQEPSIDPLLKKRGLK